MQHLRSVAKNSIDSYIESRAVNYAEQQKNNIFSEISDQIPCLLYVRNKSVNSDKYTSE